MPIYNLQFYTQYKNSMYIKNGAILLLIIIIFPKTGNSGLSTLTHHARNGFISSRIGSQIIRSWINFVNYLSLKPTHSNLIQNIHL